MIRIADLKANDIVDIDRGIAVSLWFQGCEHHCPGCHNPKTWDPQGGIEFDENALIHQILDLIPANGIQRDLSILGGEPLDTKEKINFLTKLINQVKGKFPNVRIFIWTGGLFEQLIKNPDIKKIFTKIDYLIDGPFILKDRDIRLKLRGSRNQRVIDIQKTLKENEIITID